MVDYLSAYDSGVFVRCDRTSSPVFASSKSAQYKHEDQEWERCFVRFHFHVWHTTNMSWTKHVLLAFVRYCRHSSLSMRQFFNFSNWMNQFIGIDPKTSYGWLLSSIPWAAYFPLDSVAAQMVFTFRTRNISHFTQDHNWCKLMVYDLSLQERRKKNCWFVTNVRGVWGVTSQTSHHCHID